MFSLSDIYDHRVKWFRKACIYKSCVILWLMCNLIFVPQYAISQQSASKGSILQGQVTDKRTGEPVDMATIHLLHGENGKLAGYTFSDENGHFFIQAKDTDSLYISVSLLGYRTYKQAVGNQESFAIMLEEEVFNLREIQIRPGRIWGQQDTINYDISRFISGKDVSIKDVIKKLPGVNVDETGQISYNGKNISNLYVEGMDLSDGRYNKITNNLDAKSVETVQLMQNHQPIRLLQKKISTENVAMNIKLKPEFRAKWMCTVQAGTGLSPFLWNTSVNAMQLSRESQSTYTYKSNNTGNDLVDEFLLMISRISGRGHEPETQSFLNQPSIMAPLKKERLLFNDVHTISGNRMYKLSETTQLRMNADYTHDLRKQERGSETAYFYPDDTIRITEQSNSRIQADEAKIKLTLENNAADKFLTNDFEASGSRQKSRSDISGNHPNDKAENFGASAIHQQITTPAIKLRNKLRYLWNRSAYTYEAHSLLHYHHHPSELTTNNLKQSLNFNHFYADNHLSMLHKKGVFTQQYAGGFNVEGSGRQNRYSIYVDPLWQINNGKWQINLSVPLRLTFFSATDHPYAGTNADDTLPEGTTRMASNPSFSAWYKLNYAWRFSLSARYNKQYGSIRDVYSHPYYTDYRHIIQNSGVLPVRKNLSYTVYGEYKNTISEFFTTLSLSYFHSRANLIHEQIFEGNDIISSFHKQSNTAESWTLRGTISKGFYDLQMKTSIDYLFTQTRAQQLNNGEIMPCQISYMQYQPKLNLTISRRLEVAYEADLRYGGSKIGENTKLTPLWNITQKLLLSYSLSDVEIGLSADHYHNDINNNKTINACFADLLFKWKYSDWQFIASASNLLDKQQYRYTQYSTNQSYTSWINIRGREFLLSARYKF